MNGNKLKNILFDILIDIASAFIYDIGIYCFAVNARFAPAGVTGIAVIISYLLGLPIGRMALLFNIPIIIITYRILGRKFIIKSIKTMLICAFVMDYIIPFLPTYTGNPFYAAICTGVFSGIGLTLIYLRGSSAGGTDFLIMAARRLYPHLSIGQITWIIDGTVILIGAFVFKNIDSVILGLTAIMASAVVIDKIMYGIGAGKLIFIVSEHGDMITKSISEETSRGATLLKGKGSFSKKDKQVIMCACNNRQVLQIRKVVVKTDPDAFIIITESNGIYGRGFKTVSDI